MFAKAWELGLEGGRVQAGVQPLPERAESKLAEDEGPGFRQVVAAVPRDGSMILSDVRGPTLSIVCEQCGRADATTWSGS